MERAAAIAGMRAESRMDCLDRLEIPIIGRSPTDTPISALDAHDK